MLVRPPILTQALNDYEARTNLIRQLVDTPSDHRLRVFNLILAMWLGSNISKDKILECEGISWFEEYSHYFIQTYFCCLALDKTISYLADKSEEKKILANCREALFDYYNKNYLLLFNHTVDFFFFLKQSIVNLPENYKIVKSTKRQCLAELSRASNYLHIPNSGDVFNLKRDQPTLEVKKPFNDKKYKLNVQGTKLVTNYCKKRYPFFAGRGVAAIGENHKIMLTADDGTVLEGVEVTPPTADKDTVVLVLYAHFQPEHRVLTTQLNSLAAFFGTTTVYLNHRNFSMRSCRFATSPQELGDDVITFVNHYRKTGKNIVLYGMCGGAAHMILAASKLHDQQIPCKLIVDRFFQKYINCIDLKSLYRLTKHVDDIPKKTILFYFLTDLAASSSIHLTNLDINFAKVLEKIPENDVLTLQAKDKTNKKVADLFIHPKNDIRYYFKKRRHHHKVILRKLINQSEQLADSEPSCKTIFLSLAAFFKACIQLVENEKITADVMELHEEELPAMRTQLPTMSINQFVRGFFASPTVNRTDFSALQAHLSTIVAKMKSPLAEDYFATISSDLAFLNNMVKRTAASRLGEISSSIDSLIEAASEVRINQRS